jgi:hypothetical protein
VDGIAPGSIGKAIEPFGTHRPKTIYNPEMHFGILPFDTLPQAMASLRRRRNFSLISQSMGDAALAQGARPGAAQRSVGCGASFLFRHGRAKAQRVARMRAR